MGAASLSFVSRWVDGWMDVFVCGCGWGVFAGLCDDAIGLQTTGIPRAFLRTADSATDNSLLLPSGGFAVMVPNEYVVGHDVLRGVLLFFVLFIPSRSTHVWGAHTITPPSPHLHTAGSMEFQVHRALVAVGLVGGGIAGPPSVSVLTANGRRLV